MNMKYEVGKEYLKDCIWADNKWIPIIGPPHIDNSNCINTPEMHYHVDHRFVEIVNTGTVYRATNYCTKEKFEVTKVMRKCYRTFLQPPEFAIVLKSLIETYKNVVGNNFNCKVCPHKGMPLEGLEPDENGHVRCPGHGLRFDIKKACLALTGDWYAIANNDPRTKTPFTHPLKIVLLGLATYETIEFDRIMVYEVGTNIKVGEIELKHKVIAGNGDTLVITGDNCKAGDFDAK